MGFFVDQKLLSDYIEKYCQCCIHSNGKTGMAIISECAVLQIHMVFYGTEIGVAGYDEETLKMPLPVSPDGSDADLNAAFQNSLTLLIPENFENGFQTSDDNLKCKLFVARKPARRKPSITAPVTQPQSVQTEVAP
jgi:hypothetical protein